MADESVLQRWSRRKLDTIQEQVPADLAVLDEDVNELESDALEEHKTDADMPPVESLSESSDFSQFLSPEVSDKLRNLALRKLFLSASFNVCDGLDDYDEDFSTYEKLGDLVTADMKFRAKAEANKLAEKLAKKEAEEAEALERSDAETDDQVEVEETTVEQVALIDDEAIEKPINEQDDIA